MEDIFAKTDVNESIFDIFGLWIHRIGFVLTLLLVVDWLLCLCGIKS